MTSGGRAAALQANALLEAKEGFFGDKKPNQGWYREKFFAPDG